MGQFSWKYADTNNELPMYDGYTKNSYLLIPHKFRKDFGGDASILETCYDGYGHFGKYDVEEVIADWNREFIPQMLKISDEGLWHCPIGNDDRKMLMDFYEGKPVDDKRWLGIIMSCYDDDNERLPYPIKITTEELEYDNVIPSISDENQGWYYDDVEEDEDEYDDEYDYDDEM